MLKLSLVFLFSISSSQAINYFRCDKKIDCAKVYGGCGRYRSVHRRYKELYESKAHLGDKTANCLAPTDKDKKYKHFAQPTCVKKNCVLVLPKSDEK